MLQQKIPATVITGFLGAGKTTIIRNMLTNAGGKKIALIINEFGDLGVDGDVLKGCGAENCTEDDIIELTNGCICCTVADDFVPTMQKLLDRDVKPDHIVIETSGLALPQPLVAAFNWPDIRTRVTVDGVVTVVDSAAVAAGRFADDHDAVAAQRAEDDNLDHESPIEELFEDQLTCADLIVLNKTDLLDAEGIAAVRAEVTGRTNRKPSMIEAKNGEVPSLVLLGIGASTEEAEENCAVMAARQLKDFLENGNIRNSVNFPATHLERIPDAPPGTRLAVTNRNVPGMLGQVLSVLADRKINVIDMINKSRDELAYNLIDLDAAVDQSTLEQVRDIEDVICARQL